MWWLPKRKKGTFRNTRAKSPLLIPYYFFSVHVPFFLLARFVHTHLV